MYKEVLVCVDNSDDSHSASKLAVELAARTRARVTGCHVYAARLHDERFRQMEATLPERYQNEAELERQRTNHSRLITRGLEIISDSYVRPLAKRCKTAGVEVRQRNREGKNYEEVVAEADGGRYSLVALGELGLGRVKRSRIGSVAERVARRVETDVLIARSNAPSGGGVIACVDGSPLGFGALKRAIELARVFGVEPEAVSVYDPDYHYVAFKNISGVLSEGDGAVFNFKEQEKLHEEIIDKNLASLYAEHLESARKMAESEGVEIKTTLLAGKPFEKILEYAEESGAFMLCVGKRGYHATGELDIGSTTENCMRESASNVYITATPSIAPAKVRKQGLAWSSEASLILERIPPFVRPMVVKLVEEKAAREDTEYVTTELLERLRRELGL